MTDVTTTPNERYGLKARRYPSWSPRTADSALRYPSSPAGVAAARKRLLFASSPAPSFELPDSPVQDTPARRRHPLSAFAHPRYEDRVPHEVIDAFAFYDANHSGFLDYLEVRRPGSELRTFTLPVLLLISCHLIPGSSSSARRCAAMATTRVLMSASSCCDSTTTTWTDG